MRALIVDDERLARRELRRLLAVLPEVEIAGEAGNIEEALVASARLRPDVLFLDIRLPGGSGFDLLERLDRVPEVIFTTAYDEYAARAFEVNALDYLVKPIEAERLAAAVEKVRERLITDTAKREGRSGEGAPVKAEDALPPLGENDRVFVRDGDRCWLVRLGDLLLFESEGNYTRVVFENHRPLVHRSLKQLDERLDPRVFFRANRRQIINIRKVERLEPIEEGRMIAYFDSGLEVELSRRRAQLFRERLSL